MITKQRLEELIKQQEVVYDLFQGDIYLIDLTMINNLGDVGIEYYNDYYYCNLCRNESDLFETREEAEWHQEFGNITRTERLKLPTWEEFKNQKIHSVCFFSKNTNCFFEMFIHEKNNKLVLYDHDCDYKYFNDIATKENYIKACRIAKAHFLGEE